MLDTVKNLTEMAKNVTEMPTVKKTLDNWLYRKTRKFNLETEMMQLEDAEKMKKFHESLQNGFEAIPEEFRAEPKRCIADRAYDRSSYYIDEEELIKLFENLIISSADERYAKDNHPAFVSIIEQLSPLDAKNLKLFKNSSDFPLVDYVYKKATSYTVFQSDVFLENPDEQDITLQSISIRNLARLGLVETPEKQITTPEELHLCEKYEKTGLFLEHVDKLKNGQLPPTVISVDALCGSVILTPFGQSFIDTCIR